MVEMRNDTCPHEEGKNKRPVCPWHNNDKKSRDVAKTVRRGAEELTECRGSGCLECEKLHTDPVGSNPTEALWRDHS